MTKVSLAKKRGYKMKSSNKMKRYTSKRRTKTLYVKENTQQELLTNGQGNPAPTKEINISSQKTCTCPNTHINCLTPKEWVKHQVAIWELYYEKRDIRDKEIHPAVFPIALPQKCIQLFTHKGELVLDPFVGIGSTLVAARICF